MDPSEYSVLSPDCEKKFLKLVEEAYACETEESYRQKTNELVHLSIERSHMSLMETDDRNEIFEQQTQFCFDLYQTSWADNEAVKPFGYEMKPYVPWKESVFPDIFKRLHVLHEKNVDLLKETITAQNYEEHCVTMEETSKQLVDIMKEGEAASTGCFREWFRDTYQMLDEISEQTNKIRHKIKESEKQKAFDECSALRMFFEHIAQKKKEEEKKNEKGEKKKEEDPESARAKYRELCEVAAVFMQGVTKAEDKKAIMASIYLSNGIPFLSSA